ncbi:MAG: TIGR04283 family arsenosugar biosynthesis glycosyltransferase [Bacteroidetes bacterium]|nr:TIGR04283 family arsenosugar biosynthesis glycosyltransferase [Bacteroidota bacterium]
MPLYSVIIPTLNEEENLELLLNHLRSFDEDIEIIISDGGSRDNTIKIAESFNVKICRSSPGKGLQLNEGTKYAEGKTLIYLHADTFLPQNSFILINDFFCNSHNKIATFKLSFDTENFLMKLYCRATKFDTIFTTFGDQAIVIEKEFLKSLGGFPNIKLFEDVELFRNARKVAPIYKFPAAVITSGRRFYKKGIILTQLFNIYYFTLYLMKVNPDKIYEKYFGK